MPVDYAKALETKSLNADLYKVELQKHMADVPAYSTPSSSLIVLIGLGALITGFGLGLITR